VPVVHGMSCLDRAPWETSRKRPVAPVMLRRALRPIGIDGHTIPEGADVLVAPVLSHRPARPRADSRVQGPAVPLPDPVSAQKPPVTQLGRHLFHAGLCWPGWPADSGCAVSAAGPGGA
jgi:hypothetical protein